MLDCVSIVLGRPFCAVRPALSIACPEQWLDTRTLESWLIRPPVLSRFHCWPEDLRTLADNVVLLSLFPY